MLLFLAQPVIVILVSVGTEP